MPRLSLPGLGAWLVALFACAAQLQAEMITFRNAGSIEIRSRGNADPYPTAITVSGINGQVINFTLTLHGLTHTFSDDLAAVVVSPSGDAVLLFSGPGPNFLDPSRDRRVTNQNWRFDDRAAATLPQNTPPPKGTVDEILTFKPGLFEYDDSFPDDEKTGRKIGMNYGFNFDKFLRTNPNGVWSLYIIDSNAGDSGTLNRWSIEFEVTAVPEPSVMAFSLLGVGVLAWRRRQVGSRQVGSRQVL